MLFNTRTWALWSDGPFGSGFIVKFSFLYLSMKQLSLDVIEISILAGKSIILNKLDVPSKESSFCLLVLSSSQ
jgi:hypothetical protein